MGLFKIVVETVQATDEGVVGLTALSVALMTEINAVGGSRQARCLTNSIAPFPDPGTKLQITEWNGDFLAGAIDMALVHGPRDISQGGEIFIGVLFPIPTLKQIKTNLSRIQLKGVNLIIRDVVERLSTIRTCRGRLSGLTVPAFESLEPMPLVGKDRRARSAQPTLPQASTPRPTG